MDSCFDHGWSPQDPTNRMCVTIKLLLSHLVQRYCPLRTGRLLKEREGALWAWKGVLPLGKAVDNTDSLRDPVWILAEFH